MKLLSIDSPHRSVLSGALVNIRERKKIAAHLCGLISKN